ncbi:MAG TPA: hypothetical protein VFP05_02750, partial [Thermomicrobiales bacterium]|nr:hypothetical protein [Thermomicrobiales bacterium]
LGTFRSEYETQWSLLMAASGVYGVDVIGVDQATGDEFTDYLVVVQTGDELRIDEVLPLSQDEN